ncbi:pentapeptide repeat-containing protein [Streptomyces sp. NPDC094437]|uniref:pentapeptide repeat-containing protein n=1 Tax=Streptomyces sp. NPDC094437 TaxID=3366060 RepID=UPI00382A8A19
MATRTIRRTRVTLPALDEPGRYLSNVTSLEGGRGRLAEFQYTDADLRELDLAETHLLDGRVTGLTSRRTRFDRLRVDSVEFTGCDLGSLRWTDTKVSRAVFRDCKLMGATLEDITLDNVLFDNCTFGYATLTRVRTAGPVIFSGCALRETLFDAAELTAGLFDACDLRLTEFDGGQHRGLDLRGNDLSHLRGLTSLRHVIIDRPQTLQLAEALAAELEVTFGEDTDGR